MNEDDRCRQKSQVSIVRLTENVHDYVVCSKGRSSDRH